jgi:hypothetical protein
MRYPSREVVVGDLLLERDPNFLDLCDGHTASLSPPRGWRLTDHRGDLQADL